MLAGQDLGCVRGERLVFAGLDLAVGSGAALVLTGPNGSGKSSLLRLLAGLLVPAQGRVTWDGAPVADDPEAHRARLAFVGHHDPIKPGLTVAENLAFWMAMRDGAGPTFSLTLAPALAAVGLDRLADQPGRYLSAGQRRRLNLARLAAVPARLWLLDEPATGLDIAAQALLAALMNRHLAGGGSIVASAHGPIGLERAATLDLSR